MKSQSKSIYICHGHIAVIIKSLQLSIRSFKIKQVLLRKNKQTKKTTTKTILTPFLNRPSGGCRRGGGGGGPLPPLFMVRKIVEGRKARRGSQKGPPRTFFTSKNIIRRHTAQ